MVLQHLKLRSFRNYSQCDVSFYPGKNVLFGLNGQGKTNLLESIYYLALTKSFRTNNDKNLILYKEEFFRIQAELSSAQGRTYNTTIAFSLSEGKRLIYNNQRVQKFSEYIGIIPIVLLATSDLEISQAGPQKRRHFLDVMLSQASKIYLNDLIQYKRALKQRNTILQMESIEKNLLVSWEEALVQAGVEIITKRLEAISELEEYVRKYYQKLSASDDKIKIVYQYSFPLKGFDNLSSAFKNALKENIDKDLVQGKTSVGPHRDDLQFLINGKPLRVVGSQGEHKTFTIALKMAEFFYLQKVQSEPPILLFDDIFGELDPVRILNMIDTLSDIGQVFITTTSPNFFGKVTNWDNSTFFYEVVNATVNPLGNQWQKQNH